MLGAYQLRLRHRKPHLYMTGLLFGAFGTLLLPTLSAENCTPREYVIDICHKTTVAIVASPLRAG